MKWIPVKDLRECGYYLARWKYLTKSFRVSELWFDGRNWWSARHYLDGDLYVEEDGMGLYLTDKVTHYMEKPKAKLNDN